MIEGVPSGMSENKAYQRHLKRVVVGAVHRWSVVVPPEFESLCRRELETLGLAAAGSGEGIVEFSGKLRDCYAANLHLRTASRVFCSLDPFRAGIAEELRRCGSAVPWELWLNPRIPVRLEVHVRHSRIEHEGLVGEMVLSGLRKRFRERGFPVPDEWRPPPVPAEVSPEDARDSWRQRIYVHLRNNHCVISLDTSGHHLHKRGYRLRHGGAPLRETIAAAVLYRVGWNGSLPLVDGMCGAGTLAIEAALMARNLPPGLTRPFLFQHWPSYGKATWEYLCRKAREGSLERKPGPLVALDRDPDVIETARENASRAGVADDVLWECRDFFSFRPGERGLRPGLLLLNPPYGRRLRDGGESLYRELGAHLREHFRGWQAAVLAPSLPVAGRMKIHPMRFWKIEHGGLPVVVGMARI